MESDVGWAIAGIDFRGTCCWKHRGWAERGREGNKWTREVAQGGFQAERYHLPWTDGPAEAGKHSPTCPMPGAILLPPPAALEGLLLYRWPFTSLEVSLLIC